MATFHFADGVGYHLWMEDGGWWILSLVSLGRSLIIFIMRWFAKYDPAKKESSKAKSEEASQ